MKGWRSFSLPLIQQKLSALSLVAGLTSEISAWVPIFSTLDIISMQAFDTLHVDSQQYEL